MFLISTEEIMALILNKNNHSVTSIGDRLYSKVMNILDKNVQIETSNRIIQNNYESPFTDFEQSVLWRCMNDKVCPEMCENLSQIVDNNSEKFPFDLYRGVSSSLLQQLYGKDIGDTLDLRRVTSFSEDFNIARQFASYEIYGTRVILHVVGPVNAFPYSKHMMQILLAAPDSEFHGVNKEKHRKDNVDMVMNEQEWMINECTRMKIIDIIDDEQTGMCIYKVEIV